MDEWAYTWEGREGPFTIVLAPGVFAPTRTSMEVAEGIVVHPGDTVIDVGSGSGVLSFVAARLGAGRVFGTDINPRAIEVARHNADLLGLADAVDFRQGSLFEPLDGIRANVVIGDVSGIPHIIAEASDWFPGGFSGGPTVRRCGHGGGSGRRGGPGPPSALVEPEGRGRPGAPRKGYQCRPPPG